MANLDDDLHAEQLRTLQAIQKDLGFLANRDQECLNLMRDSVKELRMILIGVDGSNGLRFTVKEHDAALKVLQKWQTQAMTLFLIMQIFGVPAIIFFIQQFLK